jgi:hypothetical protein
LVIIIYLGERVMVPPLIFKRRRGRGRKIRADTQVCPYPENRAQKGDQGGLIFKNIINDFTIKGR